MSTVDTERIQAPRPPDQPAPFRVPVLATLAPMIGAIALWLVTGSPFALLFAALGPVTAMASLADSRIGSRRTRRRELARFEFDEQAVRLRIEESHERERTASNERTPAARTLVERRGADPYRWRGLSVAPITVTVGTGQVRSAQRLERPNSNPADSPAVVAALDDLQLLCARVDGAPVVVDARFGIGVVGPALLAEAVARGIAVQLAWSLPPNDFWCRASGRDLEWMSALPHPIRPGPERAWQAIEFGESGGETALVTVAIADSESQLPGQCAVVLRVGGSEGAAIVQHPDQAQRRGIRMESISREQARAWAEHAATEAQREGLVGEHGALPETVRLGLLACGDRAGSLACELGVDCRGDVTVDLVAHGPHAVIGGTTGSGKSELLISWVLAMAAAWSPERVNFLLVDFKGGSAFTALAALPHTAGIITDLDEAQAARALASLSAELRHRERFLAQAGARSIDDTECLPRLVIVVDEFAAMLAEHPDLHALFADIAARGRSLGVHLVLCTQRPAGVVRDSVLANADLRISLRVNNSSDSSAVVGTDDAAMIPARARGRGVLRLSGEPPRLAQFALAGPTDAGLVAGRWAESAPIRTPWQPPLRAEIAFSELPSSTDGIPFGFEDRPDEQRISTAVWRPASDGHLVVLGASGSGKSTVLETLAAAADTPRWLPREIDGAWDAVAELDLATDCIVFIDDIDSLLPRFSVDHRQVFIERLSAVLRDGPSRGLFVVLTAQRLVGELQFLAGLAKSRLMLAHASRQDWVVAGAAGADYLERLPAGGGLWGGRRVQVACGAQARPRDAVASVIELEPTRPIGIVTPRVTALVARLGAVELATHPGDVRELVRVTGNVADDGRRTIIVGDVDEWQSRWGAIAALRQVADIVFDGCSIADYRALTRSRELPPPLRVAGLCWLLDEDGVASRARLP